MQVSVHATKVKCSGSLVASYGRVVVDMTIDAPLVAPNIKLLRRGLR
jgi:hypothetical protein